jgi:hypothetical protein
LWVDECDRRLDVDIDRAGEGGVDQDSRRVGSQAVVVAPRLGLVEFCERADAGREVQDRVDVPATADRALHCRL